MANHNPSIEMKRAARLLVSRFYCAPGEARANQQLNEAGIREIRARSARGDTNKAIAFDFGLDVSHVWRIVHRQTWNNVN